MSETFDYIAPVYLDTQLLTDILASIYDGFSFVEKITSRSALDESKGTKLSSEFGIPNILNILKIGVSGGTKKETSEGKEESRSANKYHTYGSLLHKSIQYFRTLGIVKNICDFNKLKIGDFIEINGQVSDNPIQDAIKKFQLFINFINDISPMLEKSRKGKAGASNEMKNVNKFVERLEHSIKETECSTILLETEGLIDSKRVVSVARITNEYLRDKSLRELFSGEYRLFGKVIKIINADNSIDLLKNTSFSILNSNAIQNALQASSQFQEFSDNELIQLPEIKTQIKGPALQILPIALYV